MQLYWSTLFFLFVFNLSAQTLSQLHSDLDTTDITNLSEIERKAADIFDKDPFDPFATYILIDAYRYNGKYEKGVKHFQDLIAKYPDNPKSYLLVVYNHHPYVSLTDTIQLYYLKKVIDLDANNFDAIFQLGASYLQLFKEQVILDSLPKPIYYANQAFYFSKKIVELDSGAIDYFKYFIINLATFLGDLKTAEQFEKLKYKPFVDENRIPIDGQYYFPVDKFISFQENWKVTYNEQLAIEVSSAMFRLDHYSANLKGLKEPLIYDQIQDNIFRFTWLRTNHEPVAIRVQKTGNEILLYWKVSDGKGGYGPGRLKVEGQKEIRKKDWKRLKELLQNAEFWNLTTKEITNVHITGGAHWIYEGVENGVYHVVDRHSTKDKIYLEIGKFLISLTGLEIPADEIY